MPDDLSARAGPLLSLLRERTAAGHRAVEGALDLAGFAQRERYAQVLARMYGFHAAFEDMLARCDLPPALAVAARRKTPWLAQDLAALGHDASALAALPRCAFPVPPADAAEAIGCLYVTEGATLGGQVIRKALTRMHAADPLPMRFFTSHGADTAREWRTFCALAEAIVQDAAARERAVAHAVRTFATFGAWLTAPSDRSPT